jgi:hypothetical protein
MPVVQYIFLFLVMLITSPVWATNYFVSTSGSDSNNGLTTGTAFRNPQACVSIMVAGDTCEVGDGTYNTDTLSGDGTNAVVRIIGNNGSSGSPITLRSTNLYGAKIVPTNTANHNYGIQIARQHWIVERFDIDGSTNTNTAGHYAGVVATGTITGSIVRTNKIHHIGRNICNTAGVGINGMFLEFSFGLTVDGNLIYQNGRRRNGESGCSGTPQYGDHGIYIDGGGTITIQRNVFYRNVNGYDIQVYSSPPNDFTTVGLNIHNNTFGNHTPLFAAFDWTPSPVTMKRVTTVSIRNNISSAAPTSLFMCASGAVWSGVVAGANLSSNATFNPCEAGATYSNMGGNVENATSGQINFTDPNGDNYALMPGSIAIDTGTNVGLSFNGSAPDKGGLETSGSDTTPPAAPTGLVVQ